MPTALAGGSALTGEICPLSGDATGLPAAQIVQTDEQSQGETTTVVPSLENTSPMDGEIVYGPFTALAQSGLPWPNDAVIADQTSRISVTISPTSGGGTVFTAPNVNTISGTGVWALSKGSYDATSTVTDVNGDTRTVTTRFIEQGSSSHSPSGSGSGGHLKLVIDCKLEKHDVIKCTVSFAKSSHVRGKVQVELAQGKRIAALGHATIKSSKATLTMRGLRKQVSGRWTVTVVVTQPGSRPTTTTAKIRLA